MFKHAFCMFKHAFSAFKHARFTQYSLYRPYMRTYPPHPSRSVPPPPSPSQYPLPPPPGTYILQAQVRSAPFIQDCCAHMSGERGAVLGECRPLGLLSAGSAASGLNTYIYCARWRRGQNNCLFCLELRVYSTCSMLGVK